MDVDDLRQRLQEDLLVYEEKFEAVAISLLNSHSNDAHEWVVQRVVREELGPNVAVICSADILREVGEYERAVTTCKNAPVKPVMQTYLRGLVNVIATESEPIHVLKNDGGLIQFDPCEELPVNILMSGPAGGAKAVAGTVTQRSRTRTSSRWTWGGTSTDCALIDMDSLSCDERRLSETAGAGGGSVMTYMEVTETLRVGLESASTSPGPACYGKGGRQATVTDANLVLGYLPSTLLGGEFSLDVEAAVAAVEDIALQMKLPVTQTAEDIITIVNETIRGAASSFRGTGVRSARVCAGSLWRCWASARQRGWPTSRSMARYIPPSPGVLCALGDVTTNLSHEQSATFIRIVSETSIDTVREEYAKLEQLFQETLDKTSGESWPMAWRVKYQAVLRYKGQAWSITVDLEEPDELVVIDTDRWCGLLREKVDQQHQQLFTYCLPDFELDLMRLGVVLEDASQGIDMPVVRKAASSNPPAEAKIGEQTIVVQSKEATCNSLGPPEDQQARHSGKWTMHHLKDGQKHVDSGRLLWRD